MTRNDQLRETDRSYLRFKMKRIAAAKRRGNEQLARRHANELRQYFNLGDSERPLDGLDEPFRDKLGRL